MKTKTYPFLLVRITIFCLLIAPFLFLSGCKKRENHPESSSGIRYLQGGVQDKVQAVIRTTDGGFLYVGYTVIFTNTDAFALKIDAHGNQQWYKTYGGKGLDFFKHAVSVSDGGYLAVGGSNSNSFDTAVAARQGYAVRLDNNGNLLWENNYGTKVTQFENVVEKTDKTGFLITGQTNLNTAAICLVSIDKSGLASFNRVFSPASIGGLAPMNIPDLYAMYSTGVLPMDDGSGNILLGGISSKSYYVWDVQNYITHMLVVSSTGLPMRKFYRVQTYENWGYVYSYNQRNPVIRGYVPVKILKQPDGYLVATFTVDTGNYSLCMQLIKTDVNCNIYQPVWHKEYHGLNNAILNDLHDNGDGTFLLTGSSSVFGTDPNYPELFNGLKVQVVKVDNKGEIIWTKAHGSEDNANVGMCSAPQPGGGIMVAGYNSSSKTGNHKMLWMKLDENGNLMNDK